MESELTSAIIKKLLLETMQLPEEVFTTYNADVQYIKEHFNGKAPSLQALKSQRNQLLQMKQAQYGTYRYFLFSSFSLLIFCKSPSFLA